CSPKSARLSFDWAGETESGACAAGAAAPATAAGATAPAAGAVPSAGTGVAGECAGIRPALRSASSRQTCLSLSLAMRAHSVIADHAASEGAIRSPGRFSCAGELGTRALITKIPATWPIFIVFSPGTYECGLAVECEAQS